MDLMDKLIEESKVIKNNSEDTRSRLKAVNNEESSGEVGLFDHPASDLKIGGEAIQPLPSTLHGLLQTISELMLILPVGSSLQQIAMTCWGIKFKAEDHSFLHQSHVFSTISQILSSVNESSVKEEEERKLKLSSTDGVGASARVSALTDISQQLELKVSSRPAMTVSLLDNSTETFWESGDEDRNRTKWVTLAINQPQRKLI